MYGIVARFDGRGARAVRDLGVTSIAAGRDFDVVYFIVDVFDDGHGLIVYSSICSSSLNFKLMEKLLFGIGRCECVNV